MAFDQAMVAQGGNRDFVSFRHNAGSASATTPGGQAEGSWFAWDTGDQAASGYLASFPRARVAGNFPNGSAGAVAALPLHDVTQEEGFQYGFDARHLLPVAIGVADKSSGWQGGGVIVMSNRPLPWTQGLANRSTFQSMGMGEAGLLQVYGFCPRVRVWSGLEANGNWPYTLPSTIVTAVEDAVLPFTELRIPEWGSSNTASVAAGVLEPANRGTNFTSAAANAARLLGLNSAATVALALATATRDLSQVSALAQGVLGVCSAFLRVPS